MSGQHSAGRATSTSAGAADLVTLAEVMDALSARACVSRGEALDELVRAGVEHIPGARWASVTTLDHGCFRTEASSDPLAERIDAIQYDVGSGPCVDAVLEGGVFCDRRHHPGRAVARLRGPAAAATGLRSVMAHRLNLHDESSTIAALNVYSDAVDAMSHDSVAT